MTYITDDDRNCTLCGGFVDVSCHGFLISSEAKDPMIKEKEFEYRHTECIQQNDPLEYIQLKKELRKFI